MAVRERPRATKMRCAARRGERRSAGAVLTTWRPWPIAPFPSSLPSVTVADPLPHPFPLSPSRTAVPDDATEPASERGGGGHQGAQAGSRVPLVHDLEQRRHRHQVREHAVPERHPVRASRARPRGQVEEVHPGALRRARRTFRAPEGALGASGAEAERRGGEESLGGRGGSRRPAAGRTAADRPPHPLDPPRARRTRWSR